MSTIDSSLFNQGIWAQGTTMGEAKEAAKNAGKSLSKAESDLMEQYAILNNPKSSDEAKAQAEGQIEALTVKYQSAQRIYEMITTMLKNMHDQMMNQIRKLRN